MSSADGIKQKRRNYVWLSMLGVILVIGAMFLASIASQPRAYVFFPISTKPGQSGLARLRAEWCAENLRRMGEPSLLRASAVSSSRIYRLIVLPTYGNAISVRVTQRGDIYQISSRRLSGNSGFETGRLVEEKDVSLTAADSRTLDSLFSSLNFFGLPTEGATPLGDADEWVLEAAVDGKYHVVMRCCISYQLTKEPSLGAFVELCKFLISKSGLTERPKNGDAELLPK